MIGVTSKGDQKRMQEVRDVRRKRFWLGPFRCVSDAIERERSEEMACKNRASRLAFLRRMKGNARFSYSC